MPIMEIRFILLRTYPFLYNFSSLFNLEIYTTIIVQSIKSIMRNYT